MCFLYGGRITRKSLGNSDFMGLWLGLEKKRSQGLGTVGPAFGRQRRAGLLPIQEFGRKGLGNREALGASRDRDKSASAVSRNIFPMDITGHLASRAISSRDAARWTGGLSPGAVTS